MPRKPTPATAAQPLLENLDASPTHHPSNRVPTKPPPLPNSFVRRSPPHGCTPISFPLRNHGAPASRNAVGQLVRLIAPRLPLALSRSSRWWRQPRRPAGRSTSTVATCRHSRPLADHGQPGRRPRRSSSRHPPSRRTPHRRYNASDCRHRRPPPATLADRGARRYGGCCSRSCRGARRHQPGQLLQDGPYPSPLILRRRQCRRPRMERRHHRRHPRRPAPRRRHP